MGCANTPRSGPPERGLRGPAAPLGKELEAQNYGLMGALTSCKVLKSQVQNRRSAAWWSGTAHADLRLEALPVAEFVCADAAHQDYFNLMHRQQFAHLGCYATASQLVRDRVKVHAS